MISIVLNALNIDWKRSHWLTGVILIILLAVLQGTVLEIPMQTIFCIALGGHGRVPVSTKNHKLKLIINYNLLATCENDIDECMQNMFEAYMGNLHANVSAVLVSATKDIKLKDYELYVRDDIRRMIYSKLYLEGMAFCKMRYNEIHGPRLHNFWSTYRDYVTKELKSFHIHSICKERMDNFMVVHRLSKVLRKCGQYQDLILLSEGETKAYTCCDRELYNDYARTYGDPLFETSADTGRIVGKRFDYTLVLDGDTTVPEGTVIKLLDVAAGNPDRGIIQPGIEVDCKKGDTLFMHLDAMRQVINLPLTNAITALFDHSSFFGKGLINNKLYIQKVIGYKSKLIERVPIDVLSHDSFEASIMNVLYVGSIPLREAPPYNYVTWGIRERRWNKGEVLLAMYYSPRFLGKPLRYLQRKFQKNFVEPTVRTISKHDFVFSFIAHCALRQMFVKPLLLLFLIVHMFGIFKNEYASISVTMFLVIIFPKFATCNSKTYKIVIIETLASILQFTPEAVTGTVRICRAFHAIITNNTHWIPQSAVEEEFKRSNHFVSAFRHLWGYSLFSVISVALVFVFIGHRFLFLFMATTVFLLPIFTAVTSHSLQYSVNSLQSKSKIAKTSASKRLTFLYLCLTQ